MKNIGALTDWKTQRLSNLYKIKSPDGKISYLFGTFHIAQDLPDLVVTACERACTLVVEHHPGEISDALGLLANWRFDNPGSHNFFSDANFSSQEIAQIKAKLSKLVGNEEISDGMLEPLINSMTPLHLLQQLILTVQTVNEVKKGMDVLLKESADRAGTKISSLEPIDAINKGVMGLYLTYAEQLKIFKVACNDALKTDESRLKKFMNSAKEVYESANLAVIEAWCKHSIMEKIVAEHHPDLTEKIYHYWVTERDENFFVSLKEHLNEGNRLIAVGIAHLPGMLQCLQNASYELSMVPLDGSLDEEYPPITQPQLDYAHQLADYLYRSRWFDNPAPESKVLQRLQHSFFSPPDATKIAKYINQGKHGFLKDEKEGLRILSLTQQWCA